MGLRRLKKYMLLFSLFKFYFCNTYPNITDIFQIIIGAITIIVMLYIACKANNLQKLFVKNNIKLEKAKLDRDTRMQIIDSLKRDFQELLGVKNINNLSDEILFKNITRYSIIINDFIEDYEPFFCDLKYDFKSLDEFDTKSRIYDIKPNIEPIIYIKEAPLKLIFFHKEYNDNISGLLNNIQLEFNRYITYLYKFTKIELENATNDE